MANFTDGFNRADGALGADWQSYASVSAGVVVSNKAKTDGVGGASSRVRTASAATGADYFAQGVVDYGSTHGAGPGVRSQGPATDNMYFIYFDTSGTVNIYKVIGGGFTLLASSGSGKANNATLKLEVAGTSLTAYHNGVSVATGTDGAIAAAGAPGMYLDLNATLDDFESNGFSVSTTATVTADRAAGYGVGVSGTADGEARYGVRAPGLAGLAAGYVLSRFRLQPRGSAAVLLDLSPLELEAAPAGAADRPVKGPYSLYLTVAGVLRKLPDTARRVLRGSGVVYDWSLGQESGRFCYRQDLPRPRLDVEEGP